MGCTAGGCSVTNQTSEGGTCFPLPGVNEACVNSQMSSQVGQSLGNWSPVNNCYTYAAEVAASCFGPGAVAQQLTNQVFH